MSRLLRYRTVMTGRFIAILLCSVIFWCILLFSNVHVDAAHGDSYTAADENGTYKKAVRKVKVRK